MKPGHTMDNDWPASLTLAAAAHLVLLMLLSQADHTTTAPYLAQPSTTRVMMQLQQPASTQQETAPPNPTPSLPEPLAPPRPEMPQPQLDPLPQRSYEPPMLAIEEPLPPPVTPQEKLPPEREVTALQRIESHSSGAIPTAAHMDLVDLDGDVDVVPRVAQAIQPHYPLGARQRGESGEVGIELRITARGQVADVKLVASSSYAALDKAACDAVRKARFEPARRGSMAVAARVRMNIVFQLTTGSKQE